MFGRLDPLLQVHVPSAASELWAVFLELGNCRPSGFGGMSAVPQTEIQAWQANHGVRLTPWELETLAAMDRAAINAHAASQPGPKAP